MSNQFDPTNRGGIWKNENRQSDRHPHFTGHINIDGKEYWLSGWKKDENASERAPLVQLTIKPKDEAPSQSYRKPATAPVQEPPKADEFGDDIPW